MKKLVVLLALLLAIETYGVYGGTQAKHIYNTCTLEVGPLCFAWEENAIGKLIGKNRDLEDALVDARKHWEKDFVERMMEAKKSGDTIQKAIDEAKKGLEKLQDKLKDVAK